jgi:hypothetical protein
MDAVRVLSASSILLLSGCGAMVRDNVQYEQGQVREAVQIGTPAHAATETMIALGYSCREVAADAVSNVGVPYSLTFSDCSKAVGPSTQLHVCLMRTTGIVRGIEFGLTCP